MSGENEDKKEYRIKMENALFVCTKNFCRRTKGKEEKKVRKEWITTSYI